MRMSRGPPAAISSASATTWVASRRSILRSSAGRATPANRPIPRTAAPHRAESVVIVRSAPSLGGATRCTSRSSPARLSAGAPPAQVGGLVALAAGEGCADRAEPVIEGVHQGVILVAHIAPARGSAARRAYGESPCAASGMPPVSSSIRSGEPVAVAADRRVVRDVRPRMAARASRRRALRIRLVITAAARSTVWMSGRPGRGRQLAEHAEGGLTIVGVQPRAQSAPARHSPGIVCRPPRPSRPRLASRASRGQIRRVERSNKARRDQEVSSVEVK